MKFLPSFGGREDKSGPPLEQKDAATQRASQGRGYTYANQPYTAPGPDIERLVRDGYEKVIWAFRAIDAIADKMSDWPIQVMEGVAPDWRSVDDDPLLPILNEYANEQERQAKYFRYRLVSQLLLSKKGVFVEVIPNRMGRLKHLNLLPPALTSPIPDPDTFLSGFRVETPGGRKPYVDLKQYDPDNADRGGVVWIRKPHPTDPYSSVTPLEAAGISLDLDFYARLYNLNFLRNDGRAGQLVAVKGGLSPEDAQELKMRFQPGMAGAGRTTVIEADSVSVQDTATTPRDAQYAELRNITKDDLLIALGTPESVLGNASGRTFDNADAEKENWLDVTVLPLSGVVDAGFDPLTKGGWGDNRRVKHDVSREPVLRRRWQKQVDEARKDHEAGRITVDEFREKAELDAVDRPGTRVLWLPGGKFAVGKDEDEKAAAELKPVGGPPKPPDGMVPGGEPGDPEGGGDLTGFDAQLDAILGGAQGEATALTTAGADLGLETKAYNPNQPRYPLSHPQGGQFMDTGDVALWLAGKPLKDGSSSSSVVDPNPGSTDSPTSATTSGKGAARFLSHPDPAVVAAARVLTYDSAYPYARVLGAPAAVRVNNPKPTKLVSLRRGDVVRYTGGNGEWTVAGATRRAGGNIELELVNVDGETDSVTAAGSRTLSAVARTPHPTKVADAKRTVAAAARAMAAGGAPAPAAAPRAHLGTAKPVQGATGPFNSVVAGTYVTPNGDVLDVFADGSGNVVPAGGQGMGQQLGAAVVSTMLTGANGGQWSMQSANVPFQPAAAAAAAAPPAAARAARALPTAPGWYAGTSTQLLMEVTASGDVWLRPSTGVGGKIVLPGSARWNAMAVRTWTPKASPAPVPPPAPAPAAPRGLPVMPNFNVPTPSAGEEVYLETRTGKVAYVDGYGNMRVYDSQGGRATTNATPGQLAQGRGAWSYQGTGPGAEPTGPVPATSPAGKKAIAAHAAAAPAAPAAAPAPAPAAVPSRPAIGNVGPFTTVAPGTYTNRLGGVMTVDSVGAGLLLTPHGAQVPQAPHDVADQLTDPSLGSDWTMTAVPAPVRATPPAPAPAPAFIAPPTPAAPAGSATAAAVLAGGVPKVTVSSGWRVTGGQGGSNPAAMMADPSGVDHYVKSQDAKHADNEVAAAMLYRAAGVQVPVVRRATIALGTFPAQQASTEGIASESVRVTSDMTARMGRDAAYRDKVLEGFAVHAWLGNWDAVENNNTATAPNGDPITIDVGGSLAFRARGTARTLGDKVDELSSMRNQSNTAGRTFKQLKPDHTDARFVAGVERIAAISPQQIRDLVDTAMPSFSRARRTKLADTLIARREHLAGEARVTLPEKRQAAPAATVPAPSPAPSPAPAAAPAAAAPAAPTPAAGSAASTPQASLGGKSANDLLVHPPNYPYPVVTGAPVAFAVPGGPKPIKAASLRKGDVITVNGLDVTVVSVDRNSGTVQGTVVTNGVSRPMQVASPNGTHLTVARTEHPTKVAEARRILAAGGAAAPAAPASTVQRTTPALTPGNQAIIAANRHGAAQQGGYLPVPGQTYASARLGDVLVVHSDGTGTINRASGGGSSDLTVADMENMLQSGTSYVPVGPRLTTATFSLPIGRHENGNGDVLDVFPDGSGRLQLAGRQQTFINETAVEAILDKQPGQAPATVFSYAAPSPAAASAAAGVNAPATSAAPAAPAGPQAPPAGGWLAAGHVVPGAVFVDPKSGDTLTIGPRGGGKIAFGKPVGGGQLARNMSAASAQSQLRRASSRWHLQSAGAAAPAAASPAAGAAPTPAAAAPAAPLPSVPRGALPPLRPAPMPAQGTIPTFQSRVGLPANGWVTQAGQTFINRKTGSRLVISSDGVSGDLTLGPRATGKGAGRRTPAQTAQALRAQGWVTESGPDIDAAGPGHAAAVRKAQRGVPLPPAGTPIQGTVTVSSKFPTAPASGVVTPTVRSNVVRGATIRVGGEDWIVTETDDPAGMWGYRPGIDDPTVLTQDVRNSRLWRQGQLIPSSIKAGNQVDVVAPAAAPAVGTPKNGVARPFDTASSVSSVTGVGSAHGPAFTVQTQEVAANTLRAGDVITLRNREGEGLFVVTSVGQDHKGREAVYGYNGTALDAGAAGATTTPEKLFLTSPGSSMRRVGVQVGGAVPPPPVLPRPAPPQSDSGVERNDISDRSSQAKAIAALSGNLPGTARGSTSVGEAKMGHLMELRGYNAHPDVVSEAELDQYVDDGEIELWRGMRGTSASNDLGEGFRTGKHYPGGIGGTMFGIGAYAAYGQGSGYFHGRSTGLDFVRHSYAGSSNAVMLRMTIKADARVGEFASLRAAMLKERGKDPAVQACIDAATRYGSPDYDAAVGYYAVLRGYDIIRKSGAYRTGKTGNDWEGGFVVVLNRSAVRVSEKNYAPSASSPAGANPPPKLISSARNRMNHRNARHEGGVDYKVRGEP